MVKQAPSRQKGVYDAYYIPQHDTAAKEKDFDSLLDDEKSFFTAKKVLLTVIGIVLIVFIVLGIRVVASSLNSVGNRSDQTNTVAAIMANSETAPAVTESVSDKIVLTSEPSGAAVISTRNNRKIGTTPFTITNPPKNKTISLRIQKDGFVNENVTVTYTDGVLNKHTVLTMTGQ
jgi:hypothetical protein